MTIAQPEHAIRAACEVSGDTELLILGSQSILGSFPNAPAVVRASVEVDVHAKNLPEQTDAIDAVLGEGSHFHESFGFYVHGLPVADVTLPAGWEARTIGVSHPLRTRGHTGHCLEAHDLAASKLAAGREKDYVFVAALLAEGLVDRSRLAERVDLLPIDAELRRTIAAWIVAVAGGVR